MALCASLDGDVQRKRVGRSPSTMGRGPPSHTRAGPHLWSANLEPHIITSWAHVHTHTTVDWCNYLHEVRYYSTQLRIYLQM